MAYTNNPLDAAVTAFRNGAVMEQNGFPADCVMIYRAAYIAADTDRPAVNPLAGDNSHSLFAECLSEGIEDAIADREAA